jgi:sugar phosphate isomerase/epimerase
MIEQLAVQMYTLREFTKTREGFADALATIHGIGYPAVQLSAVGCMDGENPEVTAADARALLDQYGLKCIATHRPWARLRDHTVEEIAFHQTLGCHYVAIGGIWDDDLAGAFRRFVVESSPVVAKLNEAGIRFGYHNHAHEFQKRPEGGWCLQTVIDDAPWVELEIDTYWVNEAGADPASLLVSLPGRVSVIHVKDKEVIAKGPVMAPVGEGNLDWERILHAGRLAGTQWYVVEQDDYQREPFDCLASSFEFLADR